MREVLLSTVRTIATPVAVVLSIIATLGAGLMRFADLDASEVASCIEDFLEGKVAEREWDEFTQIPIKDQQLNAIRLRAKEVELPLDNSGAEFLGELAIEARALAQKEAD